MVSTLARFQSSGFLPVGTLRNPCVLHHRIVDACQTIRNYPGIVERMPRSMMRRALNLMEDILSTYYKLLFHP
jgi:hypothetical protein